MSDKQFMVEVRGDSYDFEDDGWASDYDFEVGYWVGNGFELLESVDFDTFADAKNYCDAFTPMHALRLEQKLNQKQGYNGLTIAIYKRIGNGTYLVCSSYQWVGMCKVGVYETCNYEVTSE